MAHDVVEVAHVLTGGQIAGVHVHARQVAAQIGGQARVGLAGAQHAVAHGDERALVADDARVVERHPRFVERMHGRDVDMGVLAGEHAQHHAHHAAAGGGGVKRHGQVERCARGSHHVDGGHVGGVVDAGDSHGGLAALACGRREHGCGALAGGFGQPCGGLLAHAALERLGHVIRHLLAHGLVLVGGKRRDIKVGGVHVGVDGLQDGARVGGAGGASRIDALLQRGHGRVEGARFADELGGGLHFHLGCEGKVLGQLHGGFVHIKAMPGRRGHRVHVVQNVGAHYPIAPSISSLMRLFISTAYSSGSSLETGSAKPFTIIVRASSSEIPRLIR